MTPEKPKAKNPGFVTCTVDGKEVIAKAGTNMIEAAKSVGSEIPYYCYHPRLSIAANCRMCLVEVSNSPKLVPACQTALTEGLVIKTTTPAVKESQRSVLEFILLNHPVDCAICDQAGECKLQDYYMKYNFRPSRQDDRKVLKEKRKILGPLVVLDQERCILCTRCVRFMQEVPKQPQLGMFGRGSHERIDVFPGSALDSNYSGNTVDICPVGALLNRDFRFRARAWFLSTSPSVCTGCSRGCSIFVDFYGQETYRYRPRENEQINKSWMCDQGRLSYKSLNQKRLLTSRMGRGHSVEDVTNEKALEAAAKMLQPFANGPRLAVLVSPLASNEDLLVCLQFALQALGIEEVYVGGRPDGQADHYLMTADHNPNRRGLEWIAKAMGLQLKSFAELINSIKSGPTKALYAVGGEVPTSATEELEVFKGLEWMLCQSFNESPLASLADVLLPASPHVEDEGTFVNLDGIVQRFRAAYPPRGLSQPHWRWGGDLARAIGLTTLSFKSAREVFQSFAAEVPELASFAWDEAAPKLPRQSPLTATPAAADGRPAGYREWGAPRVRGI